MFLPLLNVVRAGPWKPDHSPQIDAAFGYRAEQPQAAQHATVSSIADREFLYQESG
jgi:hypothetical protein